MTFSVSSRSFTAVYPWGYLKQEGEKIWVIVETQGIYEAQSCSCKSSSTTNKWFMIALRHPKRRMIKKKASSQDYAAKAALFILLALAKEKFRTFMHSTNSVDVCNTNQIYWSLYNLRYSDLLIEKIIQNCKTSWNKRWKKHVFCSSSLSF